jgi:protein O-GlcNAc transferase
MNSNAPIRDSEVEIQALKNALAAHQSGQLADAEQRYRNILQQTPSATDALHYLGMVLHQQQRTSDEALLFLGQALTLNPTNATYLTNTGSVLIERGKTDRAVELLQRAIDVQPQNVEALLTLGSAYLQLDQPVTAIAPFVKALSLRPGAADILNILGLAHLRAGNNDLAIESLRQAVNADPNHALAHANLGFALSLAGQPDDAAYHFNQSRKLGPTGELYCYLAVEKWKANLASDALTLCLDALAIKPGLLEAHLLLAELYWLSGEIEKSRTHYDLILNHVSSPDVALRAATLISPIPRDAATQAAAKEDIAFNIDYLIDHLPVEQSLRKTYPAFAAPHFFLEDGEDGHSLATALFKFYKHIFPKLLYRAPHLTSAKQFPKLRVGIYAPADALGKSALRAVKNALRSLESTTPIEVWYLTSGSRNNTSSISGDEHTVLLDDRLEYAREEISALQLDALGFVDIGNEPLGYFLSFARLATKQVLISGSLLARGVDNFDYRLVFDMIEPLDTTPQRQHELIPLKHVFEQAAPAIVASGKTRADLSLPETGNLYFCPATLSALHPSFDDAISKLLALDPNAYILFFEDATQPAWARLVKQRLTAKGILDSHLARVLFLPQPNQADVLAIHAHSAVVLDPFKVSLGESLALAFVAGTPAVTLPSGLAAGRTGQYYCEIVGIKDCIVDDVETYVTKAVQIANDVTVRNDLATKIAANLSMLFDRADSRAELVDAFRQILDIKNN